jgi:hypothetical protein
VAGTAHVGQSGNAKPVAPRPVAVLPDEDQDDSSDGSPVVRTGDHARHAEADAVKKADAGALRDNAAKAEAADWSWAHRSEREGMMTEKSDLWPGDLCRTAHGRGRP